MPLAGLQLIDASERNSDLHKLPRFQEVVRNPASKIYCIKSDLYTKHWAMSTISSLDSNTTLAGQQLCGFPPLLPWQPECLTITNWLTFFFFLVFPLLDLSSLSVLPLLLLLCPSPIPNHLKFLLFCPFIHFVLHLVLHECSSVQRWN